MIPHWLQHAYFAVDNAVNGNDESIPGNLAWAMIAGPVVVLAWPVLRHRLETWLHSILHEHHIRHFGGGEL